MHVTSAAVIAAAILSAAPVSAADVAPGIRQSAACAPIGGKAPDDAPRVVGAVALKELYNAGQQVHIDIRGYDSVSVGQRFYIRRPMTFRGAPRAEHTIGQVTIVDVAPARATARVDTTCDAVAVGDHLEPYIDPVLPAGVDRADTTGVLDEAQAVTVSYGVDGHAIAAGRDFMLANRSKDATPGTRFAVFHRRQRADQPAEPFAEAIVVAAYDDQLLLRITEARDAVTTGDRLVMRVASSAAAVVVEQPRLAPGDDDAEMRTSRPRADAAQVFGFDELYFDLNGQALKDDAVVLLDRAIGVLRANPALSVSVEGYTCDIGTPEYNLALGERRAMAVRDYLVDHGIAPARLSLVSFGEEHAKYDNTEEDTRKLNRRAVLVVNVAHAGYAASDRSLSRLSRIARTN